VGATGTAADAAVGAAAVAAAVARSQQVAISILEPCDVTASYKVTEEPAIQDVNLDISDVQLRMSPDVMALITHQLQSAQAPLVVPPADQPLARCGTYELLWSSHSVGSGTGGPPYATAGAGGVDTMSAEKGVSIWRPQPPTGYAIVGDVITSGGLSSVWGGGLVFGWAW